MTLTKSFNLTSRILPLSTFYNYEVVNSFKGIMQTSLMIFVISLAEYPSNLVAIV